MSVQEQYAFAISDPEDGLAIASRLAAFSGAQLRWAALWTDAPGWCDIIDRCASRPVPLLFASDIGVTMICVPSPTMQEVRDLIARTGQDSFCVHWSPRKYESEEGEDARWISAVGPDGLERDDARVQEIELAFNAIPLTTEDRPWHRDFVLGPTRATGWGLRLTVTRDHMPREQLLASLCRAASVPASSIEAIAG